MQRYGEFLGGGNLGGEICGKKFKILTLHNLIITSGNTFYK
jgi:hypothetical protein